MSITVEAVTAERGLDFLGAMSLAFGFDPEDEANNQRFIEGFEWDRSVAALDGSEIVGTAGAFSLDMTVPGGTVPCGGTTVVTVRPTHRRQGILRSMMDVHLEEVREHGDPIAGLWASDSAIYGRFGYGSAAQSTDVEIDRGHTQFHRLAPPPAPVRFVTAEEAPSLIKPFYDTVRHRFPGHYARADDWWDRRRLRDDASDRNGATAYRYAVTESDDAVTGFAQWRFKASFDGGHGAGTVMIRELLGTDPESWAGLWHLLVNHDLVSTIKAPHRSIEDPVFNLLAGPRRVAAEIADSLWIRIMDVPAALTARTYPAPAQVVMTIHDPLDESVKTWAVEVGPDGAAVTATDASPEVEIDLEDLSSCYLGWARFASLGRSGRLTGDPSVLQTLDAAFTSSPQPWCSEVF